MNKSIAIAFLLIVTLPLLMVAWLGWRSIHAERSSFQNQLTELRRDRLHSFNELQVAWINQLESQLIEALVEQSRIPLSEWSSDSVFNRFGEDYFAIHPNGKLINPSSNNYTLNQQDRKTIERYQAGYLSVAKPAESEEAGITRQSWSTWFEGPGQQWAFQVTAQNGTTAGLILNRSALLAEVIARLPETSDLQDDSNDTFAVFDEKGNALYQWGPDRPVNREAMLTLSMPEPFNLWNVGSAAASLTPNQWYQQPTLLVLLINILVLFFITLMAAWYVFTRTRNAFEESRQRVSFVNQVSHEFKTPLTNIQLYAELLEDSLTDDKQHKNLEVIQEESQKLNRLVQNVLSFAKQQKTGNSPHPREIVPDDCIQNVLTNHKPSFTRRNIEINTRLNATSPMHIDRDFLEQTLGNLLSNVEKYAGETSVSIESHQTSEALEITVQDSGPGIPRSMETRIFDPFVRGDNKITEGVSGTGIGLSIARDLARLHAGDLVLESTRPGATFKLTLKSMP